MEDKPKALIQVEETSTVRRSWKTLLWLATGISILNVMIYLTGKPARPIDYLVNVVFVLFAAAAQSWWVGSKLFGADRTKVQLATDRRKARLFGLALRENPHFQRTWNAVGGSGAVFKAGVIALLMAVCVHFNSVFGLNPIVFVVSAAIAFAALPDWLWVSVLLSAAYMIVGAHVNYGPRSLMTFITASMSGTEFLVFAWYFSLHQNAVRFPDPSTRKRDRNQIVQLVGIFLAVAVVIFLILPKDVKSLPVKNPSRSVLGIDLREKPVEASRGSSGDAARHPGERSGSPEAAPNRDSGSSESAGHRSGSGSRSGDKNGGGAEAGRGNSAKPSEKPGGNGQGDAEDLADQAESGEASGSSSAASVKNSPTDGERSDSGTGSSSTREPAGEKAGPKDQASFAAKEESKGRGQMRGRQDQSGRVQGSGPRPAAKSSSRPTEAVSKSKPKKEAKKALVESVLLASLAVLFGVMLIFIFRRIRRRKSKASRRRDPKSSPKKVLTKLERLEIAQTFAAECREIALKFMNSEVDQRRLVIELYLLLMKQYEVCGIPKPDFFTPDDFSTNEGLWRPASRKALVYVTSTFNGTFYGQQTPDVGAVQTYQQAIGHLGVLLSKSGDSLAANR